MNNEKLDNYRTEQELPGQASLKKKPSAAQPLLFAATLIAGMFIGTNLGDKNLLQVKDSSEHNPNKLVSLIDFIEDNYVDSIDRSVLIDDAIQSLLLNLDPHSYYMKPEDMARENEKMQGQFDGIGIEFLILRDSLMVVKTVKNGPSETAGIKSGDRIVAVDGAEISGKELNSEKAMKLLKGKKGTEVKVSIVRPGEKERLEFTLDRGSIPLESVTASFMVDDTIGYVKIERFAQKTYKEFYDSVLKLQQEGCTSLIMDLRGNGGGLMDQAVQIVEEFLTEDKLIVYTEGVHTGKETIKSGKKGKFRNMNVVVLIDQNAASASEIVAGALQDWDRCVTVGRRTFGKGLVQREIELPDNSALRLTVARYFTPTGRCIQKPYGDRINYEDDFHQRLASGKLTVADSTVFPDSLRFITPGGHVVYGGGGIMPDVFVPLDSIYFSGLLSEFAYSGLIRDFCFNYIDQHRRELLSIKNEEAFRKNFVVTDAMIKSLVTDAEKQKIKVNPVVLKKITPQLRSRIKSQIARNLYDDNAMFQVLLESDQDFKKALQVASSYHDFEVKSVIAQTKNEVSKK